MLRLCRMHDWLTQAGFLLGTAALGGILFSYCFEVVSRYLFNAPTSWGSEVVSYLLSASVFLVMPHLTRTGGHVAVTLLLDRAGARTARILVWAGSLLGFLVCLASAWITFDESLRQIERNIRIMAVHPIPKWWVSVFLPYGFASSALYFVRWMVMRESLKLPFAGKW